MAVKKLFTLDDSLAKELELVAQALQKTQREVVESALDHYFDHTDALLADKISQDIQDGKMRVLESADVYAELGVDIGD
ncbi:hypothetical protein LGV61_03345 [Desulfurispirillum indicum]|uniref:hypothetical protein n=1 Tax=Desulfurispirillum indicum TaxID=936456 RepID=UPI001CFABF43|nr:hypothetical protein [Desulfurispirillum indicum]UCZ57328.1 hypothetical protein LGV61_03345 [Desulfurispirillum indicum]